MYGNNNPGSNNNNGGYPPYGYNNKSSGGRGFGMSHSLPSGMSRYAFSPQDTEFSFPSSSSRRGYNDFPGCGGSGGNGGSANNLGGGNMCHLPPMASNNSLNNLCGLSLGSGGSDDLMNDPRASNTNLIVNYLPQDMTDRELYALFRAIGPINTCRIMRDYKTGYSFGYAFVDFTSEMDSQRAIKVLNGITVRNKRLKVSYARPGGESIKDTNLYVTNLPRTITDDQLDTIFGKYGSIVQKNILRDKLTGRPRGVAFVRYNKREEAQEAISALNNVIPEGGSQPLSVRLAEEHGKAKAAHFMSQMGVVPANVPPPPPQPPAHMAAAFNMMHRGRSIKSQQRFQNSHPYFDAKKFI
uniref:Protein sex-lethal n=1 Tax=Drosophila melanogaster TaxID=7227 RepID=SXL_DROME|nr:Sex lethal, isoform L [Drosophila melanogaster]NP_001162690.1 Sex lethal, isoform T [Drosophila melanogaster]NP_727162.2 Sex lethal, isoform D [Drosophila melanogaster]P19339.1 RecName: Full=Protein sex-lethal [Drosophila melanogaster]AAA28884.1 sex-linked protein [Drosophila melanogaster]AAA28922.1 Sx1 [Drosophila melanogaster]AAG22410.1 Sex lethal, isoform D [Drosophila melanogaster]AAZ52511.1 Sex lethal, isoform L [Drosophila melanogaster]ACZ95226.1 Sex lethal, isoform T [Drosophila m|eukprot:NP_001027065.1 Sex lethal, isoform L [Drosophila melanogaster]